MKAPLTLFFAAAAAVSGFAADFELAESLPKRTENKVYRSNVRPQWLPDGKALWYRVQTGAQTHEYVLVDLETGRRRTAGSLAEIRIPESEALRTSTLPLDLRPTRRTGPETRLRLLNRLDEDVELFWIDQKGEHRPYGQLRVGAEREQHTYEGHVWLLAGLSGEPLAAIEAGPAGHTWILDGKGIANSVEEGPEVPATPQRGFPSPDGATVVFTEAEAPPRRQVMIVESSPPDELQPRLKVFDYLKPGDPLPKPQWIVRQSDGKRVRVPRDLYLEPFTENGRLEAIWAPGGREFYFDYNQRGHQLYRILAVDAATGAVRVVVEERSNTFIDYRKKTWRHWLHGSGELLWTSERDGWCHLYLYDIADGEAKTQVTWGRWPVREVLHVDEARREVWFLAGGLREDEDPYHLHLCRAGLDGSGFVRLTEADGNHRIEFSPDRKYFVAAWSRADHPPVHELRRARDGSLVCELERSDAAALLAAGWTLPERFSAKGRDGATGIHGVLIQPSHFDPAKKYPVIENIYAGPHGAFAPKDFDLQIRMHQLAEIGFIVVRLDGMGTNHRSKAFHDVAWKNLKDGGFPDRIAWIRAAAAARPWMDLDRVGIYGGSAGGQNAVRALLDRHDFYKVAVADCGCHDNRMDKLWWNEQWMGWPVDESYAASSNVEDAHKLEGRLLLIVGELDTNVDPASTYQVVGALQKAGKDFDFMPIVGAGHSAAETPYGSRLRARFFVRHLAP